jgi:hypothetical protein
MIWGEMAVTTAVSATAGPLGARLVEYDALRRRLWILGQRCHHGAGGSLLAALACARLIVAPPADARPLSPLVMLAAAGGALMAHDWKDRSLWFELGYGSQP